MGDTFGNSIGNCHLKASGFHCAPEAAEKRLVVVDQQKGLVGKICDGFTVISHGLAFYRV